MRACYHLDPEFSTFRLQKPAGATIGIDDKNAVIIIAMFFNSLGNGIGYLLRIQMQVGGQAGQVKVVPVIGRLEIQDFARQCPAGNQQYPPVLVGVRGWSDRRGIGN